MLPDLSQDEVAWAAARQLMLQYDDLSDVVPTYGAQRLISVLALTDDAVGGRDQRRPATRRRPARRRRHLRPRADHLGGRHRRQAAPDAYLLAARTLGVVASECLVVEDTEPGLRAGRAAGALTAALKSLDGDIRLSDLDELADLLDTNGPEPSSRDTL